MLFEILDLIRLQLGINGTGRIADADTDLEVAPELLCDLGGRRPDEHLLKAIHSGLEEEVFAGFIRYIIVRDVGQDRLLFQFCAH